MMIPDSDQIAEKALRFKNAWRKESRWKNEVNIIYGGG